MDDDQVQDAEIAEESEEVAASATNGAVAHKLNMESLINRALADLNKLREQLKTQKEMLDSALNNDPIYAEQAEKVKAETRKKTEIKQRIMKQPGVAEVDSKVKHIKEEINDTNAALAGYLQQYFQQTGSNQVMGDDGEVREIVFVTKLVKKRS